MSDRRKRHLNANLAASTVQDTSGFGSVYVQVKGLSGGAITVSGTADGVNYVALSGVNLAANASVSTIAADGIYAYPGLEAIQYTNTGTATTVAVLAKE